MAQMDVTVGVRQRAGDQDATSHEQSAVIAFRPAGRARKLPFRVLALAACFAGSVHARHAKADDFFGPDKALHFGVSAGLSAGGYAASALVLERPWQRAVAGATFALSAGIAKELWDLSGHGDPSWKDLAWDGIGTGVGVGLALGVDLLLFRRRGDAAPSRAALVIRF